MQSTWIQLAPDARVSWHGIASSGNSEDLISQLSFSDGEDKTAFTQAGDEDAEHNDVNAGAAASTSGDTTTASTSNMGQAGVDAAAMAPQNADATRHTVADAREGGRIHIDGQHTVAEGDKGDEG